MTLPSSFPLSVSQINVELGRSASAPFSSTGSEERNLAGVLSGPVSFSDFLGKSEAPAKSQTFVELNSGSGTITGVSFGPAATGRVIAIAVHWTYSDTTHRPITSATIGGVAATIAVQRGHSGGSTGLGAAIIYAIVPTGTTGSVAVNFSVATPYIIAVYNLRGLSSSTPTSTGSDESTGTMGDLSVNITVAADGMIIAAHQISTGGSGGVTWTGATERYGGPGAGAPSGASISGLSVGSRLITADVAEVSNAGNDLVVASWA